MNENYKIAVTGATGFIGEHLVQALVQQHIETSLLIRCDINKQTLPFINYHQGDILDVDSLPPFVKDVDIVIHLAGYAHVTSGSDVSEIVKHRSINLQGTQTLFRSAVQAGARRFVYVSSVKVGGEDKHDCLDETTSRSPHDPYSIIKRQTEEWLFEASVEEDIELTILRPALVYGSGVKGNLATMLRGIDRGWFTAIPETHNQRSMISVSDVVSALIAAATRPQAAGRTCILTDGETYSTRRIYTAMASALGRRVPVWSVPPWFMRRLGMIGDLSQRLTRIQLPVNSASVSKLLDSACYKSVYAQEILGFEPKYRLEDVLPEMVTSYRSSGG